MERGDVVNGIRGGIVKQKVPQGYFETSVFVKIIIMSIFYYTSLPFFVTIKLIDSDTIILWKCVVEIIVSDFSFIICRTWERNHFRYCKNAKIIIQLF